MNVTKYVLVGIAAICLAFVLLSYHRERKKPEQDISARRIIALEVFYIILFIALLIGRVDIFYTVI